MATTRWNPFREMELMGGHKEDFKIAVNHGVLTIQGERNGSSAREDSVAARHKDHMLYQLDLDHVFTVALRDVHRRLELAKSERAQIKID